VLVVEQCKLLIESLATEELARLRYSELRDYMEGGNEVRCKMNSGWSKVVLEPATSNRILHGLGFDV
jgi:hypothetical protein